MERSADVQPFTVDQMRALTRLAYVVNKLHDLCQQPLLWRTVGPLDYRLRLLRRAIYSLLDDCECAQVGYAGREVLAAVFPD